MASKNKSAKARSQAAKRGWDTRRKKQKEAAKKQAARSRAAKKGWKTRKAPAVQLKRKKKVLVKKKAKKGSRKKPLGRKSISKISNKEKDRIIADLQDQLKLERMFKTYVHAEPLANLRRDGTIAVMPSILRHYFNAQDLHERLVAAKKRGDLEYEANKISANYDVPIQEVYTLLFSP